MIAYNAGIAIVDEELNIVDKNFAFSDFVSDAEQKSFLSNVYPEDQHLLYEMVEHLAAKSSEMLCFRIFGKKSDIAWVAALCRKTEKDSSKISIAMKDINSLSAGGEDIDYGTGLLSKQAIIDYAKARIKEKDRGFSLCIVDIDNFKKINDTMGHSFGDRVLLEVGKVISDALGSDGKAGRIGGDEIMLIVDGKTDNNSLRPYLRSIREGVEHMRRDKDGFPLVTVSIGSGSFPVNVDNYDALFNLADKMLYRAKNRGRNRYVMYNPDVHGPVVDGELDTTGGIVSDATPQDKTRLVLGSLDGFFGKDNKTIITVFMQMIATYEVDEGYIFCKKYDECFTGFKRRRDESSESDQKLGRIVESNSEMSFADDPVFLEKFNSNGIFVVDTPENQLRLIPDADKFFKEKEIKHAFFYKMNEDYQNGYIALYYTRDNSRKIPQSDIIDFTYLGKMIEITLKNR